MPILANSTFEQLTCLRSTSAVLCLRWDLNLGRLIRILRSVPLDYGPVRREYGPHGPNKTMLLRT